jgi:hypothetical protein
MAADCCLVSAHPACTWPVGASVRRSPCDPGGDGCRRALASREWWGAQGTSLALQIQACYVCDTDNPSRTLRRHQHMFTGLSAERLLFRNPARGRVKNACFDAGEAQVAESSGPCLTTESKDPTMSS